VEEKTEELERELKALLTKKKTEKTEKNKKVLRCTLVPLREV